MKARTNLQLVAFDMETGDLSPIRDLPNDFLWHNRLAFLGDTFIYGALTSNERDIYRVDLSKVRPHP